MSANRRPALAQRRGVLFLTNEEKTSTALLNWSASPQLVNHVTNGSRQACRRARAWFQRRLLRSLEQRGADLLTAG